MHSQSNDLVWAFRDGYEAPTVLDTESAAQVLTVEIFSPSA
jgi:hypothetical protein